MSEQNSEENQPADPGPKSAPAPQAAKPKPRSDHSRSWPSMLAPMLFAALIGGGVAAYWQRPAVLAENNRLDAAEDVLSALGSRLTMAESRLDALEIAPQQGIGGPDGGFESRLGTVEERLRTVPADLAERLNGFALRTEQATLDTRLAGLEAASSGGTLRRAAMVLALADLSRSAMEARPFTLELNALAAAAPNDAAVALLRPHAAGGVPTTLQLAARFGEDARAALTAERAGAGEGFWARLWSGLSGLVSVRRVGNVEGDDTQSRLARAEFALAMANLAAAVDEVRALQGGAANAMADWLGDAEARLAVEQAVAGINARIVAQLAAPAPPPVPPPAQQGEADTGP